MIKPIEKGAMRKMFGNNPIGTHKPHTCSNGHETLRRRDDTGYKCQMCLQISFNGQMVKPETQLLVPLLELDRLIPDNKEFLTLKEIRNMIKWFRVEFESFS